MSAIKRRRTGSPICQPSCDNVRIPVTVLDLPHELLASIFRMCRFRHVAESLRLVCRRFSSVATSVLNNGAATVGPFIDRTMQFIEQALLRVQCESDLLKYSRAYNALEIIRSQFRLVQAVTWRYVNNNWSGKAPLACFYGGRLLDSFIHLIRMARSDPRCLGCHFHYHQQDRDDTDRIRLHDLANKFMFHFEKFTERPLNGDCTVSGARVIDLLDCIQDCGSRKVEEAGLNSSSGRYHYRATYLLRRSWFTSLNAAMQDYPSTWQDEQRFVYLRLRRLISNLNDHILEHVHYEREVLVRFQSPIRLQMAPPLVSTYTGYGQYGGKFFYYGNMNKSAYNSRFVRNNGENMPTWELDENINTPPCLDLKITVQLYCIMDLAPLAVYETFKLSDFDSLSGPKKRTDIFNLKVDFHCTSSDDSRLPSDYHLHYQY